MIRISNSYRPINNLAFLSKTKNNSDKKPDLKKIASIDTKGKKIALAVGAVATTAVVCALFAMKNKNKVVDVSEIPFLKKISNDQKANFANDVKYKTNLMNAVGIPLEEDYKLAPIIGADEFEYYVNQMSLNPEKYSPGKREFARGGVVVGFTKENVETHDFAANLHMHTVNSDGKLKTSELLDQAAAYADERYEATKEPFIIALTDHDSVASCKEAIAIIKDNPYKFRNLKVVLGIENSLRYFNEKYLDKPVSIHMLSYGVNPYSSDIDRFITKRVNANRANIASSVDSANLKFSDLLKKYNFNYDIDEFTKLIPSLGGSVKDADYFTKDYLQFKLIFSNSISSNTNLMSYLSKFGVSIDDYNFFEATRKIPQTLNFAKGENYWEYYYKALKSDFADYVKNINPDVDKNVIISKIGSLDDDTQKALGEIEGSCFDPESSLYVPKNVFPEFTDAIRTLSTFEDGVLSFAHPGVMFPYALKDFDKISEMYDELYRIFAKQGGSRAKYIEGYYQSYYDKNGDIFQHLCNMGDKYNFMKTGGLDTHTRDIFSC